MCLFHVLDEIHTLLGLSDQVGDHGVQGGLLGLGQGAVVQHLLHAVGAQTDLQYGEIIAGYDKWIGYYTNIN